MDGPFFWKNQKAVEDLLAIGRNNRVEFLSLMQIYDKVLHEFIHYFNPKYRYRTIRTAINFANIPILRSLQGHLFNLMKRCIHGTTPVLEFVGGRNNFVDERYAHLLLKLVVGINECISIINEELTTKTLEEVRRMLIGKAFLI